MEQVRKMVKAGTSIRSAVRDALAANGLPSVTAFADKYQLNRSATSAQLAGTVRATDATLAALIAELGGTAPEWAELLWLAGKPTNTAANH